MSANKSNHVGAKSGENIDLSVAGSRLTGTPRRKKPHDKQIVSPPKGVRKKSGQSSVEKITKPSNEKDGAAGRKAELEKKIRKRVALEEKAFRIVEKLLDPVEEEFLQNNGRFIDHNHYQDVVEERSITSLCGYPLCSNKLTNVPKQKYRISVKTNKVYDITERKKFCSNHCFKSSQYYEKQLSTNPVWLREEEEPVTFMFLREEQTRGGTGEEIIGGSEYTSVELKEGSAKLDQSDKNEGSSDSENHEKQSVVFDEIAEKFAQACIDIAEHEAMQDAGGMNSHNVSENNADNKDYDEQEHPQLTEDDDDKSDDLSVSDVINLQNDDIADHMSSKAGSTRLTESGWQESDPAEPSTTRSTNSNFDKVEYCQKEPDSCQQMEILFTQMSKSDKAKTKDTDRLKQHDSDAEEPSPIQVNPAISSAPSPRPSTSRSMEGSQGRNSGVFLESLLDIDSDDEYDADSDNTQEKDSDIRQKSVDTVIESVKEKCEVDSENHYDQRAGPSPLEDRVEKLKTASQPVQPSVEMYGEDTTKAVMALHKKRGEVILEISNSTEEISPEQKAIMRIQQKKAALEGKEYKLLPLDDELRTHSVIANKREVKAQMLMDFIDRKEELETGAKETVTLESKATLRKAKAINAEKKTTRKVMYTDPLPLHSVKTTGRSTSKDTMQKPASKSPSLGKYNQRKSKISKEEVLANIARAKQQVFEDQSSSKDRIPCIKPKDMKRPAFVKVKDSLSQWVTSNTIAFIYHTSAGNSHGKNPADFETKYRNMGLKVDRFIMNNSDVLDEDMDNIDPRTSGKLPDMATIQKDSSKTELCVGEVRKISEEFKGKGNEEKSEEEEVVLPHVDSQAQMAIRRKIVLDKITKVLPDLLRELKLSPRDISADVRHIVSTFRLSSDNIMLRPAEWTLTGYILLQLLSIRYKRIRDALDDEYAGHYFNTMILSLGVTESQVQNLVQQLTVPHWETND